MCPDRGARSALIWQISGQVKSGETDRLAGAFAKGPAQWLDTFNCLAQSQQGCLSSCSHRLTAFLLVYKCISVMQKIF